MRHGIDRFEASTIGYGCRKIYRRLKNTFFFDRKFQKTLCVQIWTKNLKVSHNKRVDFLIFFPRFEWQNCQLRSSLFSILFVLLYTFTVCLSAFLHNFFIFTFCLFWGSIYLFIFFSSLISYFYLILFAFFFYCRSVDTRFFIFLVRLFTFVHDSS